MARQWLVRPACRGIAIAVLALLTCASAASSREQYRLSRSCLAGLASLSRLSSLASRASLSRLCRLANLARLSSLCRLVNLASLSSLCRLVNLASLSSLRCLNSLASLSSLCPLASLASLSRLCRLANLARLSSLCRLVNLASLSSLCRLVNLASLSSLRCLNSLASLSSLCPLASLASMSSLSSLTNLASLSRLSSLASRASLSSRPRPGPWSRSRLRGRSALGGGRGPRAAHRSLLNAHNTVRALAGAPPLTWSAALAESAQEWSSQCTFQHSHNGKGENLASGSYRKILDTLTPVRLWYEEEVCLYNPDDPRAAPESTGHYTQMVWSSTRSVGCGYTYCGADGVLWVGPNTGIFVCQYDPPGNASPYLQSNVAQPSAYPARCPNGYVAGSQGRSASVDYATEEVQED
ncbi:Pathogenesis-related protein 1B [Tetrabaena socialis]|uniref:Pathogenesis-related protein 1B n=1 Tax=Tetrabaena socialis TaxID=47790 RepID=A0A2J8A894_9CHLO|nr:Pathogenesis-related protein 1B [Tetrabaena socialis]|eukprot:PNH08725.1 Pathogenesis-related protein 1B [Tetrabaena socialis]